MDMLSNLLAAFASAFNQDERLFNLHFSDASLDAELLPHTIVAHEHISAPYVFDIECLSSDTSLPLKTFIGCGVDIAVQLGDGSERVVSGVVTASQQLGSDGGFARYGLTVEPAYSALKLRRNSRVFQDKSVVDIVGIILDEHIQNNPVFAQCFRHREQLTQDYPTRSYCQQYRESDFVFIERLLREEGISYYFDFEHGSDEIGLHTLVLFDAGSELNPAAQSSIRFHRADQTEADDTITQWQTHRQIQPGAAQLASYDYKGVYAQQGSGNSAVDHGETGSGLTAGLEDYDPQSLYYGSDNSDLNRYAQLRQQSYDLRTKTFAGKGVVRGLGAGQTFALTQHPNHDGDNEFVVLSHTFSARNNLPGEFDQHPITQSLSSNTRDEPGYQNSFQAVRKHIPIVPDYAHTEHAKPTIRGTQTATVVGPQGEEIYTDELGRIKIQFHWAREQDHDTGIHGAGANKDDFSSCWVRVGYPSAGANWGHQFIPRIGQEVLVNFIEGDIDRPIVMGALYNGQQNPPTFQGAGSLPANKTLSGIKTHEYKGSRHNELVFDDTTGEIRTTLSTEHGKTQLNQGFLIHPRTEGKGEQRGEGFELRTDNAGAIRAAQGLLITTEAQPNAAGKQLDRESLKAQLSAAKNLTDQLGSAAQSAKANKPEPDPALDHDYLTSQEPYTHIHGEDSISITTPQSLALVTGKDLNHVSQRDTHQTSGRRWIHNVADNISLFVAGAGNALKESIKLIAAKGDVQMQAQSADIEIDGDQSLTISACKESITASAKEKIVIHCGGAQIELSGGNITVSAPGNISLKGAQQSATGPTSLNAPPPMLPILKGCETQMSAAAQSGGASVPR
ncbi:MAG: type VI secretion system tip protein TssI/VgrG [Spongiibacteraceae bacterium]